ncbi:bile acid:sodium symporter family protein [Plantactinospora sp. KBS50]|uniref:bile acid:sodium symporter family protein n=1 Tax=Plantactinospora sp. KBS50 TaxID=2024580 RepID=UPI000BAB1021|nr:bile acid:sodium symporter family protein [Plantactinospora sp. KBS50]ASW54444.1 symporter [Plantactinospora sp. KBS50]
MNGLVQATPALAEVVTGDVDSIRIAFDEQSMVILRVAIGAILFGIALDTRVEDFRRAARRPGSIAIGVAAQFLVLPAITFALTLALHVRGSVALGMILVACCPPGNVSNIVTHLARGDVALSVSMTAVSNLLAIVLMPLNFALWGSLHPTGGPMMRAIALNPVDMLIEVGLVIGLPFLAGIALASRFPQVSARASKVVGPAGFLLLGGLIAIALANNLTLFLGYIGIVFLAVLLHDALALGLGYGIARLTRLPGGSARAMTFEVGIRNAGLGLLLVFSYFDGLGGMALVAAWWGIWDIIAALAVAGWWRRWPVRDAARFDAVPHS